MPSDLPLASALRNGAPGVRCVFQVCEVRSHGTRSYSRTEATQREGKVVFVEWYDRRMRRARDLTCSDTRVYLELEVRRGDCRHRGAVKRERLDFLTNNPFYTKRLAYRIGRRYRSATVQDVAKELRLDWHTVYAGHARDVTPGSAGRASPKQCAGVPGGHGRCQGARVAQRPATPPWGQKIYPAACTLTVLALSTSKG